ncbi:SBP (S-RIBONUCLEASE BINDING PROTEIN) FAMILY PROTEIN [Salix koriyanagi]|uniref:SBP (S-RIBONUCLEASE BINDING PROTEIN) FAMILY PROTEIN n=1 Tax=Salix koriyanagi TaxID=2511006 RepID=A0A9Q1AM69_9ROSI|nr:SBP (S-RIBONUCLEASE BINDING PROTEIN) FAMILY PROTEIN [Salix koriyanagi]
MAVEARHISLFPPQLLCNREMMNPIEADTYLYNTQMGYGVPLSGTTTTAETLLPDRKRPRDSISPLLSYPTPVQSNKTRSPFSFFGQDLSFQIQQQQLDTDCLISQHMEKVRMEIEERRKRHARRLLEAIETGMMKRLRAKEDEIEKIGKLNWALEEKNKSSQPRSRKNAPLGAGLDDQAAALMDDAQSCCGSSGGDGPGGDDGGEERVSERCTSANGAQDNRGSWMCRNCNREESCVFAAAL